MITNSQKSLLKTDSKKAFKSPLPLPAQPSPGANSSAGLKIAIVGAFLLSLLSLAGVGILYQSLSVEQQERAALEAARIQLQDQIDTLQQDNERFQAEISKSRDQLKTNKSNASKIKKELDQRYIDISNYRKKIRTLDDKVKGLESKLKANVPPVVAAPVAPVIETMSEVVVREPFVQPVVAEEAVVEPVAEEVSVPAGSLTEVPAPSVEAPKVMTINRKFNFVVINMGMRDQLKMGDRLRIQSEGSNVATIQVEKLYDRFAAATILDESQGTPISKGDLVVKA